MRRAPSKKPPLKNARTTGSSRRPAWTAVSAARRMERQRTRASRCSRTARRGHAGSVASAPACGGPGATPSSRSRWARWPSSSPSSQRPGLEVAETKVDLHVAPGSFLRDVLSAWTPSGSLGPRLRRPVRRLPVADGAVLRARRPPRPARLGRRAAVDRRRRSRSARGAMVRLLDALRRAPARRRPPGRRAALHAQPVRRHLRGAHVDHAAGHGGAAVAAAVRAPRAARSARVVVAGGLRARADLDRRRGQRRRHRLAAARPGAAGGLRAGLGRGGAGRGARLRGAARAGGGARLAVVGRGRARPRALRPGLPALHRAAGDDLEHDLAARVAAAAGLLDELHRRRLHGHAARLPGRRRRLPGARAGRRGDAGHPRAVPGVVRVDAARALRALLPRAGAPRPAGDVRRLPRRGAAAPRGDLHLQPRAGRALPAHELQGGAARVARASPGLGALAVHALRPRLRAPRRSSARRRWSPSRAGRWRAASAWTASSGCPHGVPAAWRDAAHDLDRTLPQRPARAWSCPASSSPSTTGAGPTTRSCRR